MCVVRERAAFANYNLFSARYEFISFCHAPDTHHRRQTAPAQITSGHSNLFQKEQRWRRVLSARRVEAAAETNHKARTAALTKHCSRHRRRRFVRLHDLKIITTIRRRINLAFVTLCVLQVDYGYSAQDLGAVRVAYLIRHSDEQARRCHCHSRPPSTPTHTQTHAYTHKRTHSHHTQTHDTLYTRHAAAEVHLDLMEATYAAPTHPKPASRPSPHLVWLIVVANDRQITDSCFSTHTHGNAVEISLLLSFVF